ncbi:DUF962 domain-containing protein [Novosphingobium resinovorum]|uniref:Mpo1 family 2-hydroxy fatty acid dioxygenase n=1 Tax=Novosphingobium resinovorum TaxID=158500 RepID=UPI002ED11172|nr:Mpo1-like protein [Novosphingobium resinovorum]
MSERLVRHLANYAAYHRDRRNVATHMVGIPLIVLAVEVLLARPRLAIGGIEIAAVDLAIVAACCFYFTLDRRLACAMAVVLAVGKVIAGKLAEQDTATWLSWGIGLFVTGWLIQFLGHWWEGRKPAFLDDLRGLLIGPLFVLAEAAFHFGRRLELRGQIEARLAR